MSDEPRPPARDPAIALLEFDSIATGIAAGDAMVKASPLGSIYAGTVHPGHYLVLVSGDTAAVEVALDAGRGVGGTALLDEVFLPDIHPAVVAAIAEGSDQAWLSGEALGIVETTTVAAAIEAADAGVKGAFVDLGAVRLADGLGGKGYVLFAGAVAEVEAAVERAGAHLDAHPGWTSQIISQLHGEMARNLLDDLRFRGRVAMRPAERGG